MHFSSSLPSVGAVRKRPCWSLSSFATFCYHIQQSPNLLYDQQVMLYEHVTKTNSQVFNWGGAGWSFATTLGLGLRLHFFIPFSYFFHLNLIGKCTWLHHSHGIDRTTSMIFQHDGGLSHQADYIACSEKNAEYDVQGSLGLSVMISLNLRFPSSVNSYCPSSAFNLEHGSSSASRKVQCFSLVTGSWKIAALNTFDSDIFRYSWCSTEKYVKVHCSCQQPVRVTRNWCYPKIQWLNTWTSIFDNFSRFPFCKSLNQLNMLLTVSERNGWSNLLSNACQNSISHFGYCDFTALCWQCRHFPMSIHVVLLSGRGVHVNLEPSMSMQDIRRKLG